MALRATREAFGSTLCELIEEELPVMAVDADLAESTTLMRVRDRHPEAFVDVGIAEQCMIGVASGLSLAGRIPFTGSFAVFATGRAYDQIRNTVCDSNLNVKICPTHAGVTVGEDGATHQALEDIGLMRGLPGMRILVPSDYNSARAALRLAVHIDGPVYVRLGRYPVPELYPSDLKTDLPSACVLRYGYDVSIIACGVEVHQALIAADILAQKGISAEVIDVLSVAPLDEEAIVASAKKTRYVVTCEEHNVRTGMGSAVAALLGERWPTPIRMLGMNTFGESGAARELLSRFGLDATGIAETVHTLLSTKDCTAVANHRIFMHDLKSAYHK